MELSNVKFSPASTPIRIGIDVGSTTVKVVCLDQNDKVIYGDYQRHRADIRNTIITVVTKALEEVEKKLGENNTVSPFTFPIASSILATSLPSFCTSNNVA